VYWVPAPPPPTAVSVFGPPSPNTSTTPSPGDSVTSASASAFSAIPLVPTEIVSGASVPSTTTRSDASPSRAVISISELPDDSAVAPGPNAPPVWSMVRVSPEPSAPEIVIESVLDVVAAPQATGVAPKRISVAATTSVACVPAAIAAVTARVVEL
jgi:hypothetical protein